MIMSIEQRLEDALKQAMRTRDQATMDVVRMIKARVAERRTAKGFSGQVDDALVREVIGAYRKQMQKALEEYGQLGDKGAAQAEKLRFEIAFCAGFLPAALDEQALEQLVRERMSALGVGDAKQVGKLVGDVMRTHKGQVEAGDVKRVAERILGASS
jgi:uncharacterized protein YqeY